MNNSCNSTSWDENWLDEYRTVEEKLRDIADRSISQDPACDYGLVDSESCSTQESIDGGFQPQKRKVSQARKYSNYRVFTKEEAATIFK